MIRRTWGERLFDLANAAILILFALTTLYPMLHVLSLSFSTPADALTSRLDLIPRHPTLDSYRKIFAHPELPIAYWNTIRRTALGIFLSVLLTSLIAYPLSKKDFPHRKPITKLFVFSMLFNGGIIPMYFLIQNLGLLNTIWPLVLPGAVGAYNMFVMRNFFEGIPQELIESARIDGASEFRIYARIILPLSVPVLAVMALWVGVGHWNAWFDAMLYTQGSKQEVLQLFLRKTVIDATTSLTPGEDMNIIRTSYTPETLNSAVIMAVTLPILFIYPFLQRYFVKGILLGSVKG